LYIIFLFFSPYLQHADMSGQAASYYNTGEGFAQGQPQQDYNYNAQNNGSYQQPQYQQPAGYQQQPGYQQPTAEPKPPPPYQQNMPQSGYSFDEAFKVEKPKWNDLWAGLLVC
jgi:hypothetical protein